MFGYVRPLKTQLSAEQSSQYQAAYCGLCRVIGKRYGFVAQMFLNYDFAFLAILLAEKKQSPCLSCKRCGYFPWRKRDMWQDDAGLELAAAESVVLCYWKIKDSIADSGFFKALLAHPLKWLLHPAYRRACLRCAAFAETVQVCLAELREMETAKFASIDRPADAFARILQAAAAGAQRREGQAAIAQLLYHLGRWIYLIDAWDDLEEDQKSGSYNPILLQGLAGDARRQAMELTLSASLALAQDAYTWLDAQAWSPIIENILQLGLPGVTESVLSGAWKTEQKRSIRRSRDE